MKKRMITWLLTLCAVLCLLPFGANAASKLSTPDVTAKNVASSGKIQLSWDKVKGAETYRIYRATGKNGTYKKIKTTSKTSYTDTSAVAGKQYYYKVKAVEEDGDTSKYSAVDTRVCDLPQPDVTVTNTASTGKVKLSWKAIDGAEKYVVYRASSKNGEYKKVKTTASTTYTDSSAKVGRIYYYQVVAVHTRSSANSAKSAVVKRVCDLPRPDVTVKLNSSNQPKVSWKTIEGAENYTVYRSTAKNGEYTKLTTTTKTSYTDKTAEAGTTYYYKVKAIHEKGAANSAYSSVDKIQVSKASDSGNNGDTGYYWFANDKIYWDCASKGHHVTNKDQQGKRIQSVSCIDDEIWEYTCDVVGCGETWTENRGGAGGVGHKMSDSDRAKITKGDPYYQIRCICGMGNPGSTRDEALAVFNEHLETTELNCNHGIDREWEAHHHNFPSSTFVCVICEQNIAFNDYYSNCGIGECIYD